MFAILAGLALSISLARSWWSALDHSSVMVHGQKRTYTLVLPAPQQNGPFPLVVFLQDPSETIKAARYRFGLDAVAVREHFAIAYPEAADGAWNAVPSTLRAGDDMDFMEELVKNLVTHGIADPKRVYLAGETGGGRLAFLTACKRPDGFAATAVVTSTMSVAVAKDCGKPARPMPLMMINGTNDVDVSWQGISNPDPTIAFLSVSESAGFWKRANRCDNAPVKKTFPHLNPGDATAARLELYPRCDAGSQVAVYAIDGGGHQAPSLTGDDLWNPILGPRNHDFETGDEIWKFFAAFKK